MQLYAVNFTPLLGSLYMFRVFYTPFIRSTIFNCIYSDWYKPYYRLSYLLPVWPGTDFLRNVNTYISIHTASYPITVVSMLNLSEAVAR